MSVCIVHRDGWAVCDSRSNWGPTGILPAKCDKAFVTDYFLLTCVGDGIVEQMVRTLAEQTPTGDLLNTITEYFQEGKADGHLLVTDKARKLYSIDSNGCRVEFEDSQLFWAIGCAGDWVNGWLECVGSRNGGLVTAEDAVEAVKKAAEFDSGIDAKAKVYRLV